MSYENLVFEGGGVLASTGFAYSGALEELDNRQLLSKMKRFAGTSIGGLYSAFLAAEFSVEEINEIKNRFNLDSLVDKNCFLINLYNLWNYYGIHNLKVIENQLISFFSTKIDVNITI